MRIYDYSNLQKSKVGKKLSRFWQNINWKRVGTWLFRLTAVGVIFIAFLFVYFGRSLPDPNRLLGRNVPESTKIYDRNGGLLYEVHGEYKRTLVNLDQISPYVQNATIAVEDKDFYKHSGISFKGLARSIIVDVTHGEARQGGSTITQQFVKNAVLTREKSLIRKLKEVILSIEIEARFSKKDILKLYLNEIPYGRNAYGIQAAAQTYFGKNASELTVAQSAYLAALPQAPSYYNAHLDDLQARAGYIMQLMKDQGYITEEQYNEAVTEHVAFTATKDSINAPHFVLYIQELLADKYGERTMQEGGLKVYTTLDPELQKIAEEAVKTGVDKFSKRYNANNAALVATDPKTGQILAMVGGKDYFAESSPAGCTPGRNCLFEPHVNVAIAQRQPGSSFKPYGYLTAFSKEFKYAPASMLVDVTTNFGNFGGKDYIPHNYNGANYGPVSMRQALAGSLNIPAVKTIALVGVENVVETARDLGITSPMRDCGLSLVLGGCEVRLVDHVSAYGAIANMGKRHQQSAILKIEGQDGKILEEYQDKSQQVVDPQAAYELINIMTDNQARSFIFGSNSPLHYPNRQVGCKTGTTQNWRDGWTLCFTPSIALGVWAGNNDGRLMKAGADGSFVAAPIVKETLTKWLQNKPNESFAEPQGITKVTVDSVSGKLPSRLTPSTKTEIFADYAVPTERDNIHVVKRYDTTTGQEADEFSLAENITERVCLNLRSEKPDNPNWERPVRAWVASRGGCSQAIKPEEDEETQEHVPTINITQPRSDANITQFPLQVAVSVSGENPIARVELIVDGNRVATATSSPYTFTIRQLSDGQHVIAARAIDSKGAQSTDSVTITVGKPDKDEPEATSSLNQPSGTATTTQVTTSERRRERNNNRRN
jgi:1A family penicillin-binding protein